MLKWQQGVYGVLCLLRVIFVEINKLTMHLTVAPRCGQRIHAASAWTVLWQQCRQQTQSGLWYNLPQIGLLCCINLEKIKMHSRELYCTTFKGFCRYR